MNEHKHVEVTLDELFSEQYSVQLLKELEDGILDISNKEIIRTGDVDRDGIRLYDLDISTEGIKVGKVYAGRVFSIVLAVLVVLGLLATVYVLN